MKRIAAVFSVFNKDFSGFLVKEICDPLNGCPCTHKGVCTKIAVIVQAVKIVLLAPFGTAALRSLYPVKAEVPDVVI